MRFKHSIVSVSMIVPLLILAAGVAQEKGPPAQVKEEVKLTQEATLVSGGVVDSETKERYEAFEKLLTDVKLVGHFTIDGKSMKDLQEESYEIKSAKKLPDGNLWQIMARIKYAKFDVTVPMALNVEWAGSTPMISLDKFTIPGMGTFSARVVFHDNKYAGTWSHDAVGGHLFGRIEKAKSASE